MALVRWGLRRQNFHLLRRRRVLLLKLTVVVISVLLFCEYFIYYLVLFRCHWPEVKMPARGGRQEPVLKAMFLADTHLLGEIRGHWLDKLRREWQMERAFQTALWLLQPEVVFILGDVFDEGKWSSAQAWADDLHRFQRMFRHGSHVQLKVVIGNHDIGFHYHFVMVNSVAMEGDGCTICSEAEAELREISRKLNCSQEVQGSSQCDHEPRLPLSAPVLLQHYPLYRASDANCSGEDAAPPEERSVPFEEKYDVLSREASQKLLWWLRPRLILSGHTHSACEVLHPGGAPEVSVPSFSWRNRNNPSFIMGSLTSRDYALSKCYLPCEDTVLTTYCAAAAFLLVLILAHFERLPSSFLFGWKLCRSHLRR
ncbi:metallophosphoesterase 1 isoform X4 [Rattus norvegicus]|uniref:metallophosphoesterase 1 isoform X4 n=1 Tax=Rattus norvegicus TaxID=10116 RepID=UPI0019171502|nr:metallophosphoesterase 1 isoform X4 [Rattus norvegicus]